MSDDRLIDVTQPAAFVASVPRVLGPWASVVHKLYGNRAARTALSLILIIIFSCALAPTYATLVARTDPFTTNVDGVIILAGQELPVMTPEPGGLGLIPIGPTWSRQYLLGADAQGRDVMARLLYGGRNSLVIAGTATLICIVLAGLIGILGGFCGGVTDAVLSRLLDILWAFPIYLLAISLSIVLISQGLQIGFITISSNSLALPVLIIGIVYVPYVARPIRGQVLSLRRSDFVLAARALGASPLRILIKDVLPHVSTTMIVFAPLMMALNMLTESALSFLSIGVQPPNASWGTIIEDGQSLTYTRPLVAITAGVAIIVTVLALNVLGDELREAIDPKAKLRVRGD